MKRTLTSVPALIRALGFITARQMEAHLPKPQVEPQRPSDDAPTGDADDGSVVRARRRAARRGGTR